MDSATAIIDEALAVCDEKNYRELALLASLVRGALGLMDEEEWQRILHKSRSSPWVELSLTALAMAGRRLLRQGAVDDARPLFQTLLQRADHLDHHYHRVVSNEVLVTL